MRLRIPFLVVAVTLVAGAASAQLIIPRDTHTHVAQSPELHVTARAHSVTSVRSEFSRITQSGESVPLEIPAGMALVVTDVRCSFSPDDRTGSYEVVTLSARLPSEEVVDLFHLPVVVAGTEAGVVTAEAALTSGFVVPSEATLVASTVWEGAPLIELYGYLVPTGPVQIPLPDLTLPRPGVPPGGGPGVPPPTTEPPL